MVTSNVEQIDDTQLRVTISIPAETVDSLIDAAAMKLGGSMKVPGFRPGKVPLKVIEKRVGAENVAQEAAQDAVPGFYTEAMEGRDEQPVAQPRFEVESFERGQEGKVVATVDIRPTFEVPEWRGLTVEHPEWELTQEEVDEHLDQMRERFAELETVDRPAQAGDFVVVTLTGKTESGDVVEEASGEDMLYQVPTEETDSALDTELVGAKAGDVLEFSDDLGPDYGEELGGQTLSFTAIVKEVKVKELPALDDDFAITASEFDTIDELVADLRENAGAEKRRLAEQNLRGKVVETVAELVDIPLPEALVEEERRYRMNRLAHTAEQNGMSFEQFLSIATGGDPQAFVEQLTEEAEQTVKAQLVVDEIGQAEDIQIEQDDLSFEISRQAARLGRDPQEIAEMMLQPERIGALYADTYRRKTIDLIMEAVEITNVPPPLEEPDDEEPAIDEEE